MSVVAVVGAQFADEGKGKIVELLGREAALVAQYAGGYSPGQSMVAAGERMVFHLLPAVALSRGLTCLLAQGMAIDPRLLLAELKTLEDNGGPRGDLRVDQRAQVVLPHHIELDRLRAEVEGASGAPRRGLGPAYGDKVARRGLRIGDLLSVDHLREAVRASLDAARGALKERGGHIPELEEIVETYAACGERLRDQIVDGASLITDLSRKGERVVLEGPLGSMVDLDHGYYPYVVSASTVTAGACVGTGIPPRALDRVVGVAKSYTTRSGPGPLPSEVTGALAATLQDRGGEISPTTAHPRRCGMFDVPIVRYTARINGFDCLALTKLDVLSGLEEVPICVAYDLDGEATDEPPFEGQSRVKPIIETMPGWTEPLADCRRYEELPENARRYVERIEEASGVPVNLVSVGPDHAQSIHRRPLV